MTGGKDTAGTKLSSTEIFRNKAWTILSSAALPSPTYYLSAGNIDNTIFVFGTNLHFCIIFLLKLKLQIDIPGGEPTVGILKFNPRTEKWEDVGSFSREAFAMQAGFRYFKF